jgi:hypothetical protein
MFVNTAKKFIKKTLNNALWRSYHQGHKLQALRILLKIESQKGVLNQSIRNKCDQYAVAVLGNRIYAPWLYVYSAIANEFKEGWIPDNYYGMLVNKKFKGDYGKISSLKSLNSLVFNSNYFPDILSYANGIFFDRNNTPLEKKEVSNRLFEISERVVYKLDNSQQGLGIFFFSKDNFDIEKIQRLGNGLFQSFIKQHKLLSSFSASSVATLRITTTCSDTGEISIRACYLRLGEEGDTRVRVANVRIPIDVNNGAFSNVGYTLDWLEINRHPESNKDFSNHIFPSFDKVCSVVKELHKKVPYVRCIGWDVAVDELGEILVMEWNGEHNDIKFSEATQGPCFADLRWELLKDKKFNYYSS